MDLRNNEYDVSKTVKTTNIAEVNAEVNRVFLNLRPTNHAGDTCHLPGGQHWTLFWILYAGLDSETII